MRQPSLAPFLVLALALFPASGAGRAQPGQAPNLAGIWMFATQKDYSPAVGPRSNFGTEFVIRQDATSITIERGSGATRSIAVHPFDGSETESKQGQSTVKARARVQDGKVVLDVTSTPPPESGAATTVSTRRLWREGDALMSEWIVTSPMQVTSVSVYRQPPSGPPAPLQPLKATLSSMAWLAGVWERRTATSLLEERWTPAAGGAMLGVSRTIAGERMTAFEFLRIVERDGTLVYLAQPNGRAPATEFTLTRAGATEAVFENPTHDYPKMITYTLAPDGILTAIIADVAGLKPQHFVFKKGA